MALLRISPLPDNALDAAAEFHARVLPDIDLALRSLQDGEAHLTLVFAPADHAHRGWRLAAVQELARRAAPLRVNALAGDSEPAIAATERYLAAAPGVTGQYMPLDDKGAGPVL